MSEDVTKPTGREKACGAKCTFLTCPGHCKRPVIDGLLHVHMCDAPAENQWVDYDTMQTKGAVTHVESSMRPEMPVHNLLR